MSKRNRERTRTVWSTLARVVSIWILSLKLSNTQRSPWETELGQCWDSVGTPLCFHSLFHHSLLSFLQNIQSRSFNHKQKNDASAKQGEGQRYDCASTVHGVLSTYEGHSRSPHKHHEPLSPMAMNEVHHYIHLWCRCRCRSFAAVGSIVPTVLQSSIFIFPFPRQELIVASFAITSTTPIG